MQQVDTDSQIANLWPSMPLHKGINAMNSDLLYGISQGWIFVLIVVLFYAFAEAGIRLGHRASAKISKEAYGHVSTIEGALLGLLALLLGFAFSMSMGRYDDRRSVVVGEANDLQTTFLRAALLPEARYIPIANLLSAYVDSRIAYLRAGRDRAAIDIALNQTAELQTQLWNHALLAAQENSDEVKTGYFIESLNDLIDDHTRRVAAMENHVPEVILLLLVFVAAMTIAMTGYSSGLNQTRLSIPRFILVVLTAATLIVIIDLDRPRRGFITVNEQSMLQLQADFDKKGF